MTDSPPLGRHEVARSAPPLAAPGPAADAPVCLSCGQPPEAAYAVPLCAACRLALVRRPLPSWIWVTAGLVGTLFVLSLTHLPRSLGALVSYDRAQRAEARHDYARAAEQYRRAVAVYPDNTGLLVRLFVADAYAPHSAQTVAEAFATHQRLIGREASDPTIAEVTKADDHLWDVKPEGLDRATLELYVAEEQRLKNKGGR